MGDCRGVKSIDRLTARSGESQMKTRAGGALAIRSMFDRQLVPATGKAVADCLTRLPRPEVIPNPDITERGKGGIVKCRRSFDIETPREAWCSIHLSLV